MGFSWTHTRLKKDGCKELVSYEKESEDLSVVDGEERKEVVVKEVRVMCCVTRVRRK